MNDDILLLAERERAARARVSAAASDLRSALAPSVLTRRAVRARPWAALAVAGAGGAAIGLWLGAAGRPSVAPAAVGSTAPPARGRDWLRIVTQIGQVVGTLAAAKGAVAQARTAEAPVGAGPADV